MIDFDRISQATLNALEKERATTLSNAGWFRESPSDNKFINELRFNYGFWNIHPFLIHGTMGCKLELRVDERRGHVHLAFIGVSKDDRQKGIGSHVMQTLIDLADKYGYTMDLDVDPRQGTPEKVLRKFYSRFGFIAVKGFKAMKRGEAKPSGIKLRFAN